VVFFVLFFCWILELDSVVFFVLFFCCILELDSVVFFVLFFCWILELFRQCGIFLLDFRTVPTVWYFLFYFSAGF
jgi:hypothetical protein